MDRRGNSLPKLKRHSSVLIVSKIYPFRHSQGACCTWPIAESYLQSCPFPLVLTILLSTSGQKTVPATKDWFRPVNNTVVGKPMSSSYLMENDEEIERLERKTDAGVVERFATRAGLRRGMRVVDLCCGAGVTTAILSKLTGGRGSATGIDFSEDRINHARSRYGGKNTRFVRTDVRQPLTPEGPFNWAWVRFALEYFKNEAFDIVKNLRRSWPRAASSA